MPVEVEDRLSYLYQLLRRGRIPRRGLLQYLEAERGLKVGQLENLPTDQINALIQELRDRQQRAILQERVLTIDMEPLFPELALR